MLLTLTTTHTPATDLGYLLHINPSRAQSFSLSFGQAHVFYPEATETRCTAALLLDVDPVALVRGHHGEGRSLAQYVNDRPYVASSLLSVAIAQVLGSALGGRCKDKPEVAEMVLPLEARLDVVPSRGGEELIRRLFEPLGYDVQTQPYPLDTTFPEWGQSAYFSVTLTATIRLADLLTHLYVLIPAMDTGKHYFVGEAEVEKLVQKGEGWLADHPEKETIVRRYLKQRQSLVRDALEQLTQAELPEINDIEDEHNREEEIVERKLSLHDQRLGAVLATLKSSGAHRVLDLGCGEGRLLGLLLGERQFTDILGMDVSYRSLEIAQDKLRLDRLPPMQRERINLVHGSLIYRDKRLEGYDAAAVVEVIEHLDTPRLAAFERSLFEFARPGMVVITTPNIEYNPKFETLLAGTFRHKDHRFEWTRAEFEAWGSRIGEKFGYAARYLPLGPVDAEVGAPSQMAVFERLTK
ncbi:MAG: 3' terminal RNA ribose 2'-O-methyltransferase Hen1 [Janthinobacterium lividum]